MECHRCLEGDATLAKLTYRNGDIHEMFLCERCIHYFETKEGVSDIAVAQTM